MDDKRAKLQAQQRYQSELDYFNHETEQRATKARRLFPQIFILPLLTVGMLIFSYPSWRLFPALPWMIGMIGIGMEVFIAAAYLAYRRKRIPPQPPKDR